jgi:SAM-dependent methyltransferase
MEMREFWDERAREDAYFFVDNRRAYRDQALDDFWAQGERDLDRLLGQLGLHLESTDAVLDIGCGVGRLTRVLAARAAHVHGLDISAEMLERARAHHESIPNLEWVLGDGTSLAPLADESFDACVSHVVFQHIPDPQVTLGYVTEIGRVLRPGGWAAFQVSNDASIHTARSGARSRLASVAEVLGRAPSGQDHPAWLGSAVDLGELTRKATAAGLTIERTVGEGTQFCLIGARRR